MSVHIAFSATRFWWLLRKELLENWKPFLLRMLLVYGVLTIILVWNAYFLYPLHLPQIDSLRHHLHSFAVQLLAVGFLVFGIVSASSLMEDMNTKARRICHLMLPATVAEKFLAHWFLYAVLSLLAYLLAFFLADFTRSILYGLCYLSHAPRIGLVPLSEYLIDSELSWALFDNTDQFLLSVCIFLFVQSLFALGSCIWPRLPLPKTFAALLLLFVTYVSLAGLLTANFLEYRTLSPHTPFDDLSELTVMRIIMLILLLGTLLNWVLAYYRFKESEIIHRW